MKTTTIRFLDTPKTIAVEAPLSLDVEWGDRVSRQQDGPVVYGSLVGAPYGTSGDLRVLAGQRGHWWLRNQVTVVGSRDHYDADLTDEQRAAALATYEAVGVAWRSAVGSDPEIAAAVEAYRQIQDGISAEYARHDRQWAEDLPRIARAFRRKAVEGQTGGDQPTLDPRRATVGELADQRSG